MRWIREHKLITAIIAILMVLIIIFTVSISLGRDSGENVIGSGINQGMSKISGGFTSAGDTIRGFFRELFSFGELQEQIDALEAENKALQRQLAEEALDKEQLEQLEELAGLLNYNYTSAEFDVVTADVVSMDGSNWTNVFTISCGTESGIEAGDAVVNGSGLVGKVESTGEGWSKVISIIDEGSKVSFKMARDRKELGVVAGNELGAISGYMIDADALIAEGDTIITSGLGTYPAGLEIGTVKTVTYNSNTMLKEVTVEPVVNFRSLNKVAVII